MSNGLSTHVLDLQNGIPAAGLAYILYLLAPNGRQKLAEGATDADGRGQLLAGSLATGLYELVFSVNNEFYADVPIRFKITEPERRYHIPLLLSPYGYSTYRGS